MAGSLNGWLRYQPGIVRFRRDGGKSAFQTACCAAGMEGGCAIFTNRVHNRGKRKESS